MATRSGIQFTKEKRNAKYFASLEELQQSRPQLFDQRPSVFRTHRNILGTPHSFVDVILRLPFQHKEDRDQLLARVYQWIARTYPAARHQTIVVSVFYTTDIQSCIF